MFMKNLLFLITALFVTASSAFAECAIYIDDFELPLTELGTVVSVPVKAHFSARLSSLQVDLQCPPGITLVGVRQGADWDIDYYDANGTPCIETPSLYYSSESNRFIGVSFTSAGYWQNPNGDPDAWVSYGVVKWEGGDYDEMVILDLSISDDCQGGDIVFKSTFGSVADARGGTINENGDNNTVFTRVCHVSIQDEVSEQTAPPVISGFDDGINGFSVVMETEEPCNIYYRVTKDNHWPGEWTLYSGELRFYEIGTYQIEAYAIAEGKLASNLIGFTFYYAPPVTERPVITCELTDDAAIITATGAGEVKLYKDGVLVENPCTVLRTNENQFFTFTATAQEAGKLVSEVVTLIVTVPANEEVSIVTDGVTYDEINGISIRNLWIQDRAHTPYVWSDQPYCNTYARTAVMSDGYIYISRTNAKTVAQGDETLTQSVIYKVDANNGNLVKELPLTLEGNIYGGTTLNANNVGVDDFGHLYIAPYSSDLSSTLQVYMVDKETGELTLIGSLDKGAPPTLRCDYIDLIGDITREKAECNIMSAGANSEYIYRWHADQGCDWEGGFDGDPYLPILEFYPVTVTNWGYAPVVKMWPENPDDYSGELFYVDGTYTAPILYDITGTMVDNFQNVNLAFWPMDVGANGVCEFTLDGRNFIVYVAAQYTGFDDATMQNRACQVYICELGEGQSLGGMQRYWMVPDELGSQSDGGTRIECMNVEYGTDAEGHEEVTLFIYKCYNGMAVYKITSNGQSEDEHKPGDVNNDGEVNSADLNAIIYVILGGDFDDELIEYSDINYDGEISISDINALIDIIFEENDVSPHKVGQPTQDHLFVRNINGSQTVDNIVNFDDDNEQLVWIWLDDDEIYQNESVQYLEPMAYNHSGDLYSEITYNSLQCDIYLPKGVALSTINDGYSSYGYEQGDRLPNTSYLNWAKKSITKIIDGIEYDVYTLIIYNINSYGGHFSARNASKYQANGALKKNDAPLFGLLLTYDGASASQSELGDMIIANQEFYFAEAFSNSWSPNEYRFFYGTGGNNVSWRNQFFNRVKLVTGEVITEQTETPVITYETTDNAVVVSATGYGEVKLYKDGVLVENPCTVLRTNDNQYFTFAATAQEEGKQISEIAYMSVYVPALEIPSPHDGISIYVQAASAPYLYSWYNGVSQCGDWPGTRLSEKVTINRVEYYVYHFDLDMINVIFNNGNGSQTGDFTEITEDAFFIYNGNDLAYGLIPPEVYGNPTGEYAFYVNTDKWSQVNAVINGNTYPMTKVGVDGAGFEVYKWEVPSLSYTPTTITFNDGYGNAVQDAYGYTYSSQYVKGGYYVYSFFQNYAQVRLDRVTTIRYEDTAQRPVLENCSIALLSSNNVWNGYSNISFQISGTYFSQAARQGSVFCSIDDGDWILLVSQLSSEQSFDKTITLSFNPLKTQHNIKLVAQDLSGAYSEVVTVLEATDASTLECSNLPEVEYTGQAITFDPVILDASGNELVVDEDYTASFSNNVNVGDATLKIQAIYPQYIGSKSIYFTINPHIISGEVFFTNGVNQFYYTGDPICPDITVLDEAFGTLTIGWDYMVNYTNNVEVGQALAVVEGIGNFEGSFELPFEILILYGDVNYSGDIDITDLQAMVKYIFGEYNKPFFFLAADLNIDNTVNVQDVVGEANILLTGDLPSMSSNSRRMPELSVPAQASLYWSDGVLYLNSSVPVAAIDIVNYVDGNINWNFGDLNMVVMNAQGTDGCHTVIFSLDNAVIPAGLTAIATTNSSVQSVVAAKLSDADAELITVRVNDELTGLTSTRTDDAVSYIMNGSTLVINSSASMSDLNVTVYTIDGKVVANQHMTPQDSGCMSIDLGNQIESNRYLIIVVRNGRQIIATQKLTHNK